MEPCRASQVHEWEKSTFFKNLSYEKRIWRHADFYAFK